MTDRQSMPARVRSHPVILDPVLDFMRLLWNIEHGLQSRSKWMEATLGITGPQRLVLRMLGDRPGLSASELADIVHLHPSTVTGILQRLVSKRLIQRTRDPVDGRRVRLRARTAAKRFMHPSSVTVEYAVKSVLASVPQHRVQMAREVLTVLADRLVDVPASHASGRQGRGKRSSRQPRSRPPAGKG